MKTTKKLGRNAPCHCGSSKKYKHCHLSQDQEAARQTTSLAPEPELEETLAYESEESEESEDTPVSSEDNVKEAWWRQFESADAEGKIQLFFDELDDTELTSYNTFEMLSEVRSELDPRHREPDRLRYAKVMQQFRETAPELYQDYAPYYHSQLISDVVPDERWSDLPELLRPFAENPDKGIDEFFRVIDVLMYHGQIRPLIDAMSQGRSKVGTSGDVLPGVSDEFNDELIGFILLDYTESVETPRFDDPTLQERLAPFEELDEAQIQAALERLKPSISMDWQPEDFGETVDAEQWEDNLRRLLFDFMKDCRSRAGIPLSRSEMARQIMFRLLREQLVQSSSSIPRRSRRSGRKPKRKTTRTTPASPASSPLIPTHRTLDRVLVSHFDLLGASPYKGAPLWNCCRPIYTFLLG